MNWLELVQQILEVCIIPLLGILTTYLITLIKEKKEAILIQTNSETQKKYIELLADIISQCVIATNQTYVETLKKENAFTKEAQIEAFNLTFNAVKAILTEDALVILNYVYEDLDTYIRESIEAQVNQEKLL